jgi:hypothetical protein
VPLRWSYCKLAAFRAQKNHHLKHAKTHLYFFSGLAEFDLHNPTGRRPHCSHERPALPRDELRQHPHDEPGVDVIKPFIVNDAVARIKGRAWPVACTINVCYRILRL